MTNVPYTYLIGWSILNRWYYGVRYSRTCNPSDLWVKYFTSSKIVKQFRKEYGEPDIIQIRKVFSDTRSAKNHEYKVLKRLNISQNSKWLNINEIPAPPRMFGPCTEKRKSSIRRSRLNTPKIMCNFCNKLIDPGNYKRFHGENCKYGPNKNKHVKSNIAKKSYNTMIKNQNFHSIIENCIKYDLDIHAQNKIIHECPHCGLIGKGPVMLAKHFVNCLKIQSTLHETNS